MLSDNGNLDLSGTYRNLVLVKFDEKNGRLLGKSASSYAIPLERLS